MTQKAWCLKSEERRTLGWRGCWISWILLLFSFWKLEQIVHLVDFMCWEFLDKIDPYVETFPKSYTHILSPGITPGNTFSRMLELHFMSFNIKWNIFLRERVHLISFWFNYSLNYEWRSCDFGVCVRLVNYLVSVIHLHSFRFDRCKEVQSANSLTGPASSHPVHLLPGNQVTTFLVYPSVGTNK